MKTYFFLVLLFSKTIAAQEIALLDRSFKKPMAVTKTVTKEHMRNGKFPIYRSDLDSVIQLTESLAKYINTGIIHKTGMQMLKVGHSHFAVTTHNNRNYNTYSVLFSTRSGDIGTSVKLVKQDDNAKKAVQRLRIFVDYLRNNQHMITAEK